MKLVIFGNGSIAELAGYYFDTDSDHDVAGYVVNGEYLDGDTFNGKPLSAFETVTDQYPPDEFGLFIALGYAGLNRVRQDKFEAVRALGYEMPSYVAGRSAVADNVEIGDNCFVLENQTVQPFCRLGDNVTLWSGNHIGHHSVIADHVFISSHVVVSGHCTIGERCFIGVNATLRDNCEIGADSFVGMAAPVVADVAAGSVVVGQSGEVFGPDDRRSKALKRKYFNA
jgi:sugar O-acyltransferase (sialic acid O-acetyltransferase NeuD family)